MARTRIPFSTKEAIPAAWDLLWKDNLERQKEDKGYNPAQYFYLTAADVENQVRQFAGETARGEAWGTSGRAYGRPYDYIRIGGGDLQRKVRDWLLREVSYGRLSSHNFGRHHISGMRFRPKGAPLAEAEQKTFERREKRKTTPRPCHFRKGGGPACVRVTGLRWRPSKAWCTGDWKNVTCPRCLKAKSEVAA